MSKIVFGVVGIVIIVELGAHLILDFWLKVPKGIVYLLSDVFLTMAFAVPCLSRWLSKECLRRREAEKKTLQYLKTETSLIDLARFSARAMPLREFLDGVVDRVFLRFAEFPALQAGLFLMEPSGDCLALRAWRTNGAPKNLCESVPVGECFCGKAVLSGKVEFVRSTVPGHKLRHPGAQDRTHYCAPMMLEDKCLGVLHLQLPVDHPQDEEEGVFLEAVARRVAVFIARKQDEESLQESHEYLNAVINAISDPVFVKDREHRWVLLNDAYCRFMGCSREALLERTPTAFFPKEQWEEFARQDDRVFETGEGLAAEVMVADVSGKPHAVSLVKSLYTDRSAKKFIVGSFRDISSLRQSEEEKTKLQEQFQQAQKMEAVGLLAGGIVHDFNNVLCTIVGYNYFLLEGLAADNPLHPFTLEIKKSAEVAASLTRQLLGLTRKSVSRPRVMDLNTVLMETAKLFRRLVGENIKLVVEANPSLWPICMDSGQLEQVLLNLLVNARDAMPKGGQLTLATKNLTAEEAGQGMDPGVSLPAGKYVCLEVRDTGIGMEEGVRGRIFEPFFTTKPIGRGTGLGLSTVMGIIQDYKGDISVESALGQGSAFRIYLPPAEGGREAMLPGEVPKSSRGGHETILVVEDNTSLRGLIKKILRLKGYRIFSASTAEEGADLAHRLKEHIHLALVDLVLPDASGMDLAGRLTQMRPDMKIAYMSGYTGSLSNMTAWTKDTVLIEKPFTPEALLNTLRQALDAAKVSTR